MREGKSYLTIAIGCTGGRHRSVALAQALAKSLSIGIDTERRCSGDAGCDDGGDSVGVEGGAQQELSSEGAGEVFAGEAAK